MWCGGVANNQIKKNLLLSVSEKKLKSVNIWQSNQLERGCLVHFLRLLAVCWPGAQNARDNTLMYQRPDLPNILRQAYDCLTIMPKLRSTYDGRLTFQASCEERKDFLR